MEAIITTQEVQHITVARHVEYDDSVLKLPLDSYVTTDARHCRHLKVIGCGWSGRQEHGGVISATPWATLIQCPTVMSASGDGMSDFRDVPHLLDGDVVFVEHYGFHHVRYGTGHRSGYADLVPGLPA